jgi:hypothetical protein
MEKVRGHYTISLSIFWILLIQLNNTKIPIIFGNIAK